MHGGGEMAGLFVHCGITSSARLQDAELAVTGNISCQPQKLGFFSMWYIAGRGWSQRCLGYFLLLSARIKGKTQVRQNQSSPTASVGVLSLTGARKPNRFHGLDRITSTHGRRFCFLAVIRAGGQNPALSSCPVASRDICVGLALLPPHTPASAWLWDTGAWGVTWTQILGQGWEHFFAATGAGPGRPAATRQTSQSLSILGKSIPNAAWFHKNQEHGSGSCVFPSASFPSFPKLSFPRDTPGLAFISV